MSTSRNRLAESETIAAQRKAELEAAERAASVARMAADTEGYERPSKYAPTPDPRPAMSAREVAAARASRAELAEELARLDAPRLAAEAEAREEREIAEAAQRERAEKQNAYWSEWVQSSSDPNLVVSDAMRSARMPTKDVEAHNLAAVEKFSKETPEFAEYKSPQNADKIIAYFDRNGVRIYDAPTLKAAFIRLRDLGLLRKKPAPAQPVMQPAKFVNLAPEPEPSETITEPQMYRGRDYATGLERDFSAREVNRMSSLDYQRAFPTIQTVSELFTVQSRTR